MGNFYAERVTFSVDFLSKLKRVVEVVYKQICTYACVCYDESISNNGVIVYKGVEDVNILRGKMT